MADIYSLGAIIYQMLEGDFPFVENQLGDQIIDEIKK
jgi:serine/threonine protein kinase